MTNETWRRVEKQINKEWFKINRKDIKKGDRIRIFESDGIPVKVLEQTEFLVTKDASPCEPTGNYRIEIQIMNPEDYDKDS